MTDPDKLEALRKQAVTIRKLYGKTRRLRIGTNGHRKALADLNVRLRDAAILARHLGLPYEEIENIGRPGWRP